MIWRERRSERPDVQLLGDRVTPYYQDDAVTIWHGDAREILPDIEADLVLSDPPYGISFESKKSRGSSPAWTNGVIGHIRTFSHLWDGLRRDSEIGDHVHPTQEVLDFGSVA